MDVINAASGELTCGAFHNILPCTDGGQAMITVHVKLFATLRRRYPHLGLGEAMPVDLLEGTTVGQLVEHLRLPEKDVKVVFVNNVVRGEEYTLSDGDKLGMFPPVGGG